MGSRRVRRVLLGAGSVIALSCCLAAQAPAQSSSDIAGVWAFNGGQIGVVKNPDKSFTGTVVRATTKGACVHPIGEQIWTNVRLGGGELNWWGQHVWFLTEPCRKAPSTGNTAWKIFSDAQGKELLRGCYAHWARPELQPVIDATGAADPGAEGKCIDARRVTPKKGTFKSIARIPKSRCYDSSLRLRFVDPPTDALSKVRVTTGSVRRTLNRSRLILRLQIGEGTPEVQVKVVAKTLLGHTIRGSALFKPC